MSLLNYLTKIKIFKRVIPSIVKRILKLLEKHIFIYEFDNLKLIINPVSYTHLTLPTNREV